MQLQLINIGKFKKASINIDGITVIAGENDTGKSTLGKVLFSMFNCFYRFDVSIIETRKGLCTQFIKKVFSDNYNEYSLDPQPVIDYLSSISLHDIDYKHLSQIIRENVTSKEFEPLAGLLKMEEFSLTDEILPQIIAAYKSCSEIPNETIYRQLFQRRINTEFNTQINNVYSSEAGGITLKIRDKDLFLEVIENKATYVNDTLSLNTEIIYIDDPFILDEIPLYLINREKGGLRIPRRDHLLEKLLFEKNISEIEKVFQEVMTMKKLEEILDRLNSACAGSLEFNNKEGFVYHPSSSDAHFHLNNISTGLKTFIIIKTLLLNGALEENGTIILDEPEIHLHPEWQLIFAEIIVLLQKTYNMHILVNTHSPYFMEAIEVYSQKHGIDAKCHYYLTENNGNFAEIKDVTDNTEFIYKKLAQPFQTLENVRYSDD